NLHVVAVHDVAHPDLGHDRQRGLIDAALDGEVRVGVDDAGHDEHAGGVDDLRTGVGGQVRADGRDLAAADEDVGVRQDVVADGDDGRAADEDFAAGLDRRLAVGLDLGRVLGGGRRVLGVGLVRVGAPAAADAPRLAAPPSAAAGGRGAGVLE